MWVLLATPAAASLSQTLDVVSGTRVHLGDHGGAVHIPTS
jgi:hypothetical protein